MLIPATSGSFLGHIVSTKGVPPDPSKTAKVKEWPNPTSAYVGKTGLANYLLKTMQILPTSTPITCKQLREASELELSNNGKVILR